MDGNQSASMPIAKNPAERSIAGVDDTVADARNDAACAVDGCNCTRPKTPKMKTVTRL